MGGDAAQTYERVVVAFMLDWAENLVSLAEVAPGERVVDLACGTGFVARRAALRVGDHGHVVGIDLNPLMVSEARRATSLEILQASADATGLPDSAADIVLCQQGLQYFPDPAAALAETFRVLTPGGRVAFSVWAPLDRNPFMAAQIEALAPHLAPGAVAAFKATNVDALGGPGGVAELMGTAGFTDVKVISHELDIDLPPMEEYFPALISATPWAPAYMALRDDEQRAVVERVSGALGIPPSGLGSRAQFTSYVATGSKT